MPSRSPFLMSTFQDTGIQVEFAQGNTGDTSFNNTTVSLSSTVTQDQFILAFGGGRDMADDLQFTTSNVYDLSLTQPTQVQGADTRIVLNAMAAAIVDTNTTCGVSAISANDGMGLAIVAIDNGYDVTTATNDLGNTASISNVSTSDLIFIWETYTHSNTGSSAPSLPSGYTNVGSGTFITGRGGNVYEASYRLSYKENASGTVSYTAQSSGTNNINAGGVTLVRVQRILKDYELSSYGSPDYTITSFPSTQSGTASGVNDLLVAVDTTISYSGSTGDEGLFLELGGAGGAGFALGLDNGTTMRARALDGGGNFEDGSADALAAANIQFNGVSAYRNRLCTFYARVDISATNMRLYVQVGGRGSHHPIRLLGNNTSNGLYTNNVYGGGGKGYGQVNGLCPDLVGSGGTGAYEDNYTGTIDEIRYWGEAGAPDVSGFAGSYDIVTP